MTANQTFQEFRRKLVIDGFLHRDPVRIVSELMLFVFVTLAGVAILLMTDNIVLEGLALGLITLAGMGVSTNAHTASHNAISHQPWVNKALTYFGYPFFLQVSASYWRYKHLVVHHPHPNVEGIDDDADLMPFFALTNAELERVGSIRYWLYRLQWIYFPLLLVGNAFNVVRSGWLYLIRRLADPAQRRPEHWLDLIALLLHYLFWIGLPMLFLPAIDVITFNLLRFALMSYGMFALFAPAHFPAEAAMVQAAGVGSDVVALQTLTTVNYRTGWLGRLICGGVEYQIEHHLFPSISPTHYPRLSERVREYCEQHGYPYRTLGWGEALWKSVLIFARPKPVFSNVKYAQRAQRATNELATVELCSEKG